MVTIPAGQVCGGIPQPILQPHICPQRQQTSRRSGMALLSSEHEGGAARHKPAAHPYIISLDLGVQPPPVLRHEPVDGRHVPVEGRLVDGLHWY